MQFEQRSGASSSHCSASRRSGPPSVAAAIICSDVKIGGPGTTVDIPLAHKDNIWSFDRRDTLTVSMPNAPRPEVIVVAIAIADGGRPQGTRLTMFGAKDEDFGKAYGGPTRAHQGRE